MVIASAPAKAILIGEHAVNRAQSALAVAVGVRVQCQICESQHGIGFVSGAHQTTASRQDILELAAQIDVWRDAKTHSRVRELVQQDFFAPAKYVLAGLGKILPERFALHWHGEIPASGGLGAGGAAFAALAAALTAWVGGNPSRATIARLAWRGDIVAHGGIASGLDTATSVYGGAITYSLEQSATAVPFHEGLHLVIGDTRHHGATAQANARVQQWLEQEPWRMHLFREIGWLERHARQALANGDWAGLGCAMNLNQRLLERLGVSTPELERLIEAALSAGALGAKLSGSGGGGIMLALVNLETLEAVKAAIVRAGGMALHMPVGVDGVRIEERQVAE